MDNKDIKNIWIKYRKTKDLKYRNILIENYLELVKIVAGRMYNFYGTKVDYDDLVGYGVIGLIDSIDKFDIDKDIKFETYAQIRIRGEMIDNIRKLDWIPRTLRTRSKRIQEISYKLQNQLKRTPTNEELAKELGIEVEELKELLSDMSTFNVNSLEDLLQAKGDHVYDIPESESSTPEKILDEQVMKELLSETIEDLSERDKLIVSLYYYEELTYKEISQVLDLSESRISQLHSEIIIHMKNSLKSKGAI